MPVERGRPKTAQNARFAPVYARAADAIHACSVCRPTGHASKYRQGLASVGMASKRRCAEGSRKADRASEGRTQEGSGEPHGGLPTDGAPGSPASRRRTAPVGPGPGLSVRSGSTLAAPDRVGGRGGTTCARRASVGAPPAGAVPGRCDRLGAALHHAPPSITLAKPPAHGRRRPADPKRPLAVQPQGSPEPASYLPAASGDVNRNPAEARSKPGRIRCKPKRDKALRRGKS